MIHTQQDDGRPHSFYDNDITQLRYAVDFASFVGDLASALGQSYGKLKRILDDSLATREEIDRKYEQFASSDDLYGDVEMYGWKKAWDKISSDFPDNNFRLSDVLDHYYNDNIREEHYKNRWKIFCIENKFIYFDDINGEAQNGYYIWDLSQHPGANLFNATSVYELFWLRIRLFTVWYTSVFFGADGFKLDKNLIKKILSWNVYSVETSDLLNFDLISSESNIDYVLNKFITSTRDNLNLEQEWAI